MVSGYRWLSGASFTRPNFFFFWKIQYNVVIKKKEKRTFKEAKLKLAQASQGSLSEIPQNRQLSS